VSEIRISLLRPAELGPWVPQLRALEEGVTYPVGEAGDRFSIDHGADYHLFFSEMGEARFLVAARGDRLLGVLVGVIKPAIAGGRVVRSAYLCDLKIAPEARGTGLARRMLLGALWQSARREPGLLAWSLAYGAAMRGEKGDVMRALRAGPNPARLARPLATLRLFFADPGAVAALSDRGAPPPPPAREVLDLSPDATLPLLRTAGRKDLRLRSTGEPWPLWHLPLGPSRWGASWASYLARTAQGMLREGAPPGSILCFAIDERLAGHLDHLGSQGLVPGATCTIHGLSFLRGRTPLVHMATSEI
jgi:GNAT superfamily N-acetyltransferase